MSLELTSGDVLTPFENSIASTSIFVLQATKSQRWMPWRLKPKKDVGGCDKPRGAAYQALIRGCPNGETHHSMTVVLPPEHIGRVEGTGGIETSQYPEERKATATPLVAASEEGRGQTVPVVKPGGVASWGLWDLRAGAPDPAQSYKVSA